MYKRQTAMESTIIIFSFLAFRCVFGLNFVVEFVPAKAVDHFKYADFGIGYKHIFYINATDVTNIRFIFVNAAVYI